VTVKVRSCSSSRSKSSAPSKIRSTPFDWGAVLVENILRLLHRGQAVDFRPAAWVAHDRPGSIAVPAGRDVVWIEGTGIIREELRQSVRGAHFCAP
jgi:hypothetical protein